MMRARLAAEFELLRGAYPAVKHLEAQGEDWFQIPEYKNPPGWWLGDVETAVVPVVFKVAAAYPVAEPYGFAVPTEFNFRGAAPNNSAATLTPPFGGTWRLFSWAPDGWFSSSDPRVGSNLVRWVASFEKRLLEGV